MSTPHQPRAPPAGIFVVGTEQKEQVSARYSSHCLRAYYENTPGGGLGWCGIHPQDHFHPSRCGRPPAAGLLCGDSLFLSFIESPHFPRVSGIPAAYGIEVCTCPGKVMLTTPAQVHMHVDVLSSIGCPPSITVGAPGTQGADVAGMHGIGVNTPIAAAVAEATAGFAGDMHMPNGVMFTIGT
jgi:hypothetical protein